MLQKRREESETEFAPRLASDLTREQWCEWRNMNEEKKIGEKEKNNTVTLHVNNDVKDGITMRRKR